MNIENEEKKQKKCCVTKIIKKYDNIRKSMNSIKIRGSVETFIKNVFRKIDGKSHVEKRIKAEKIIRWCIFVTNDYIRNISKILALLKKKSEICLPLVNEYSTDDERLHALCGKCKYTASSENYFAESMYRKIISSESLIMNVKGQVMNVMPLIKARGKKSWLCSDLCKIDPHLIIRYQHFLEIINMCNLRNVPRLYNV